MKYAGMIGFEIDKETAQSVYTPTIVEHPAKGDIPRNYRKNQDGMPSGPVDKQQPFFPHHGGER